MPFKEKTKRNEYQRNYKRKQAEELKRLRQQLASNANQPINEEKKEHG